MITIILNFTFLSLILAFGSWLEAQAEDVQVPAVVIEDSDGPTLPIDEYSVFKSERVSQKKIGSPSRQNVSEILKDQVGVESQVYCANCGAKRLTINGLKGEHTSLLIDGLPLHSAVSSFYGIDTVPSLGIGDISVMRGTGASLTNPEAIGGTIDIHTVDPLSAQKTVQSSVGFDDRLFGKSENHSVLYTHTDESKTWGATLGGQYSTLETWDVDQNNVAESPQRDAYSLLAKGRALIGEKADVSLRVGHSALEILGGYYKPTKPKTVRAVSAGENDFEDGDVEKDFIGDPAKITDWVSIKRTEVAAHTSLTLSAQMTAEFKAGFARQEQQTIYQHGFDYANNDSLFVADANLEHKDVAGGILTGGLFVKDQRLRSASEVLFEQYPETDPRDIKKDSFNHSSLAPYAQFQFFPAESVEVDLALRLDHLRLNWFELDQTIEETILAPRFQALHSFNEHLTQRFSYGLGYRAPLTFFESQHGNNERGYEVAITDLEKAHSFVYSISYNTPKGYITAGSHYTLLENMAYGERAFNAPISYKNSDDTYEILVTDLLLGYKPVEPWLLELSFELFEYEKDYKKKLPTAAIEKRIQATSTVDWKRWQHGLSAQVIFSRDLYQYGDYEDHYAERNQALEPALDPTLRKKSRIAPTYVVFDTNLTYKLSRTWSLDGSITNIFNYTQAGEGDSPATWHWHFNHAHYDGLHTWGPNQGRTFRLSVLGTF